MYDTQLCLFINDDHVTAYDKMMRMLQTVRREFTRPTLEKTGSDLTQPLGHTHVLHDKQNDRLIAWICGQANGDLCASESRDLGRSWSQPTPIKMNAKNTSAGPAGIKFPIRHEGYECNTLSRRS